MNSDLKKKQSKKRYLGLIMCLVVGLVLGSSIPSKLLSPPAQPNISVRFSPYGACTKKIVEAIQAAQKNIYVMAYGFTSAAIADALRYAADRGVEIFVLADAGEYNRQSTSQLSHLLKHEKIKVLLDVRSGLAHDKIILIDSNDPANAVLFTGSFNFDTNAEENNIEDSIKLDKVPPKHMKIYLAKYWYEWQEASIARKKRKQKS